MPIRHENKARERPILFSAPMVRAILAGTKTQTRRALRDQEPVDLGASMHGAHLSRRPVFDKVAQRVIGHRMAPVLCPYGQPGDRLWVRETFAKIDGQTQPWIETDYRATYTHGDRLGDTMGIKKRWTPAIHMPRAARRITLEVTDVRVERLQAISEADAQAEGCALECMTPTGDDSGSAIYGPGGYLALWEQINGAGSWDANPWVWVVSFKRVEG